METKANVHFKVSGWDESPYREFEDGAKLTKATVSQAYEGDLVGKGEVEFLMSHTANGTASFVGMELVTGILSGKKGTFIIQHIGTFGAQGACSEWAILSGSGTGDLIGINGNGSYLANAETVEMPFSYKITEQTKNDSK